MSRTAARKIHCAQVVLDPAAVVKELVENALDAGSTRINIRIRGKAALDSITVSDNGTGIAGDDYPALCLPSATSKLAEFEDLDSIATFGFRGEALSAICAIAKSVSFLTRTDKDVVATSLKYSSDGSLSEQTSAARPVGTTTYVEDLFHNLPVRRKDALKNATREISRCVAVVQALALISVHTRIELKVASDVKVQSQPFNPEGLRPSAQYATTPLSLSALRITARSILGGKVASSLVELSSVKVASVLPPGRGSSLGLTSNVGSESVSPNTDKRAYYGCSGLVSSASLDANGAGGRAKSSHQYIFANRRPVDIPRLVRAVNDLYRRVTGLNGASPVLILNLDLPEGTYDVNVSTDKRSLLIREEDGLLSGVVGELERVWSPKKVTAIPTQELIIRPAKNNSPSIDNGMLNTSSPSEKEEGGALPGGRGETEQYSSVSRAGQKVTQGKFPLASSNSEENGTNFDVAAESTRREAGQDKTSSQDGQESPRSHPVAATSRSEAISAEPLRTFAGCGVENFEAGRTIGHLESERQGSVGIPAENLEPKNQQKMNGDGICPYPRSELHQQKITKSLCPAKRDIGSFVARRAEVSVLPKRPKTSRNTSRISRHLNAALESGEFNLGSELSKPAKAARVRVNTDMPSSPSKKRGRGETLTTVAINWDKICNLGCDIPSHSEVSTAAHGMSGSPPDLQFEKASIAESSWSQEPTPQLLRDAEMEMGRLFRQEWFKDLEILGQFNKGFIVCRLGHDLFIIDQHASDEKYNFERLQKTTVISEQRLVRPLALEFSAQDELIVLQHIDAFRAGGFGIEYRARNVPTKRLYLRSQPVSKRTMFVQDDLQEIVAMLKTAVLQSSNFQAKVLRPPRVRAMFASRACRKSIMIGTALKKAQMSRIVRNLATIEHPWTCPHGRPTMRHLCSFPDRKQPC